MQTDRETGPGAHSFNRVCGWGALRFPDWNQTCQFSPKEQGFGQLQGGLGKEDGKGIEVLGGRGNC